MHKKIVKKIIYPLHEKAMGRNTMACLKELEQQQWVSREMLMELQIKKLRDLLDHAGKQIPFYGKIFREAGFNPQNISSAEDIRSLPLLDKETIRKNLQDMLWHDSPGGLTRYNTGGSSGNPLIFYFDRRRQAYDAAARAMTHRWWDMDIGDKEIYLWGSPLEISAQDRLKTFRDMIVNELLISAFELSEPEIPGIIGKFKKFRPRCLFGYPSTIALFCKMAEKQGYTLAGLGVKVVFSTAEVLYSHMRESISKSFGGVPVVDSYGSREGGFVSHECRSGHYHVMDPNYIIEYLKDGKPAGPGENGEIVLTHLDAWGMPFIRYRTGDVGQYDTGVCECGRSFSIMKEIKGRTTDFIVTPDGRWQHALSIIYVVRDIPGVSQFKIVQKEVDHIQVILNSDREMFPENGKTRITDGIRKRMGRDVTVCIDEVTSIPRDPSGKYRYVVSHVAEKELSRNFHDKGLS